MPKIDLREDLNLNSTLNLTNSFSVSEEEELYKENIIDHYQNPRNRKKVLACTHTRRELNPVCGDQVVMYVMIQSDVIADVGFEGSGCAISQAAASILTDDVKGKAVSDVKQYGPWTVFNMLGIKISPTRSKCALLALVALQNALKLPGDKTEWKVIKNEDKIVNQR